ncbi:hypothetical protein EMIT0P4_10025 [Pseudomonas sp. IT-P4]
MFLNTLVNQTIAERMPALIRINSL